MNNTHSIRCLTPEIGPSFEGFFINTLSEVGSMNLAFALSFDPASLEMLEKIHRITSGLLVLNAVYVESECLRFLTDDETKTFQREWGLPIKWLNLNSGKNGSWKVDGQPCSPSLLKPLLVSHNITSLVSIHPRVFSWMNLSKDVGTQPRKFSDTPVPTAV